MTTKNLGDILIEQGVIDREALDRALHIQNRRLGEILIQEKLADPVAIANALKFQARARSRHRGGRLSIEASLLDELMRRLESLEDQTRDVAAVSALSSLRQSIEMMLLEPVDTVFRKAKWVAQQIAQDMAKKVRMEFEGGGLVIDRALVDDLSDVLLHLVRNAIDHGIETPEERSTKGKDPVGLLGVRVRGAGGKISLTVTDDGRGIDEDKVYQKAAEVGLITAERSKVTREALYQVLFTPGFSTAGQVSGVSGRGVGLDVVEAAAIRLGGDVGVRSKPDKGTTFLFSVPVHYARMSVLPVRIGTEWLAIGAADVSLVEKAEPNDKLRGVFSAASLFEDALPPLTAPSPAPALIVQCAGGSRWGFDEAASPEEVLVRETSSFAKGSHGVIGGARLQSGRGVLVVDLNLLAGIAVPLSG